VHELPAVDLHLVSEYKRACPPAFSRDLRDGGNRAGRATRQIGPRGKLLKIEGDAMRAMPLISINGKRQHFSHRHPQLRVVMNLAVPFGACPRHQFHEEKPVSIGRDQSWNQCRPPPFQRTPGRSICHLNAGKGRNRPPPVLARIVQLKALIAESLIKVTETLPSTR
jgi:hypothetical protein